MVCLTGENNHFMFIVINILKDVVSLSICVSMWSLCIYMLCQSKDVRNKGINQKVIVNSKNKSQVSPDKSYA